MTKKYVGITGGELFNKGAQAMSFITVHEISKRFPNCEIILFSGMDSNRSEQEKSKYKFKIMPFPGPGDMDHSPFVSKIMRMGKNLFKKKRAKSGTYRYIGEYKDIFENMEALLDISGYGLSADFRIPSIEWYTKRIQLAKRFNIPVYLMPQSFGPFDFKTEKADALHEKIAATLPYVKCIMARENEGKQMLEERYKLKNVVKTPDLVLQNKGIDLENIYHNVPEIREIDVKPGSVALIPNSKNNKHGNETEILSLYEKIVNLILSNGKNVYLVYHSEEDLAICSNIKQTFYADNTNVVVIEEELSCVDFDAVVKKFDFMIASRYHSVVHAYKEAVPAVILGWAVKYRELADMFGQECFCFNVKDNLNHDSILDAVSYMLGHAKEESAKIAEGLKEAQKDNVYELI